MAPIPTARLILYLLIFVVLVWGFAVIADIFKTDYNPPVYLYLIPGAITGVLIALLRKAR